jgi:hypothetical protein
MGLLKPRTGTMMQDLRFLPRSTQGNANTSQRKISSYHRKNTIVAVILIGRFRHKTEEDTRRTLIHQVVSLIIEIGKIMDLLAESRIRVDIRKSVRRRWHERWIPLSVENSLILCEKHLKPRVASEVIICGIKP